MTTNTVITAKNKQPTKAERMRKIASVRTAKAKLDASKIDLATARANVIANTGRAEGSARVYAHALIAKFGPDYYTFTSANSRTDNEKAHFSAIEVERKLCADTYASKYGEDGKNMPWSRAKAIARKLREGGHPREGKPLDTKLRAGLLALYRAGMKEERQTDLEAKVNTAIGELLVIHFKVDISQY